MRVLVVEDDSRMAALLAAGLSEEGYVVELAPDGATGLTLARSSAFEIIILDLGLPKLDGLDVTRRLRESGSQTPILMLTARDSLHNIVEGLDVGADDYLTKPFAFEILLARLRAISRRGHSTPTARLELGDLSVDLDLRQVTRQNKAIGLTAREFSLLELLLRNAGRPVRRQAIIESVWGFCSDIEENTLDAYIRLLRNKIDVPFEQKLIHTVRGVGYCMKLPGI